MSDTVWENNGKLYVPLTWRIMGVGMEPNTTVLFFVPDNEDYPEVAEKLSSSLKSLWPNIAPKGARYLVLPENVDIATVNEEDMRKAGWVRGEQESQSKHENE